MNHPIRRPGFNAWLALAALAMIVSLSPSRRAAADDAKARDDGALAPLYTSASRFPGGEGARSLEAWKKLAPDAEQVTIRSTADGSEQHAFFEDPKTSGPKPLLVVLHSWSLDWKQNLGIPYEVYAKRHGWAFIHPDFRGPYRRPEAAASDLVAQDIVDAVAWAEKHADIDTSRIYLAGFSGGGMTALAMAGRRPDLWAGVVAWAPVYDIPDWYDYNAKHFPGRHYKRYIEGVCGGAPRPGTDAFRACHDRSPIALLDRAREAGVPVYIGAGVSDDVVPPEHAIRAFDQLADPDGRIPEDAYRHVARAAAEAPRASARAFARAGSRLFLEKTSGKATIALFRGVHDIVYDPGLAWLRAQRRAPTASADPAAKPAR